MPSFKCRTADPMAGQFWANNTPGQGKWAGAWAGAGDDGGGGVPAGALLAEDADALLDENGNILLEE